MGITENIASFATWFIGIAGYPGVFVLMIMESLVLPVPSEAVMPFAGFLVAGGQFSFVPVAVASTLGSIVGSLISYTIGYYGGAPFVRRFGRYLLLNESHLARAERFFKRFGPITVFICRFIPVVRHLSSIPAGFAKMNVWLFSLLTIAGAGIWNCFLTWVGIVLKQHWDSIMHYSRYIDIVVVLVLAVLVVLFFVRQYRASRLRSKTGNGEETK